MSCLPSESPQTRADLPLSLSWCVLDMQHTMPLVVEGGVFQEIKLMFHMQKGANVKPHMAT